MTFDFDKVFHKAPMIIPKDCPCKKCTESEYAMNNPYYQSDKCGCCNKYKEWKCNNEHR